MNRKDRVIVCSPIRNKHTSEGFHNLTLAWRYLPFHLSKVNLRGTLCLSSGACSYLFMVASVCRSELGIPWADWTHQSLPQQVWTSWITATWSSHPWPSPSGLEWLLPAVQIFIEDPASPCHYLHERKKKSEKYGGVSPSLFCFYITIIPATIWKLYCTKRGWS